MSKNAILDSLTYARLLEELTPVVLQAGRLIEEMKARGIASRQKEDSSPVTEADEAAERLITDAINAIDPGTPIVGEEATSAGSELAASERYWLIDPIDGTYAFIHGEEDYSVNIGLIEHGNPVVGLVYHSPSDTLWTGAQGLGAWKTINGERTAIRTRSYQRPPVIATSLSRFRELSRTWVSRIEGAEVIQRGASLKFCLLAEGEVDLYPRHGETSEWDTAAADAVLRAAGGIVVAEDMTPLVYGRPSFLNPPFLAIGDPDIIPELPLFPEPGPLPDQDRL